MKLLECVLLLLPTLYINYLEILGGTQTIFHSLDPIIAVCFNSLTSRDENS